MSTEKSIESYFKELMIQVYVLEIVFATFFNVA